MIVLMIFSIYCRFYLLPTHSHNFIIVLRVEFKINVCFLNTRKTLLATGEIMHNIHKPGFVCQSWDRKTQTQSQQKD